MNMSLHKDELNHNLSMRDRLGLKENKAHTRVNHTPSSFSLGGELVVKMPHLTPTA